MNEATQDRALGRLEGKIDLIIADQEKARQDCRQQYDRLEKVERLTEATDRKADSIDRRLEKVEEPVAEFSRWRERGIGAIMLVSFAAASFGGLMVAFGKRIWAALTGG